MLHVVCRRDALPIRQLLADLVKLTLLMRLPQLPRGVADAQEDLQRSSSSTVIFLGALVL